MDIIKISAFSIGAQGGNPAGVVIVDHLPSTAEMQSLAKSVGFSETAFAAREGNAAQWRVRYFSPESEVPFCGHATIALGAVLAEKHGTGIFQLQLNDAEITVEGHADGNLYSAALQSPPTQSLPLDEGEIIATLELFGYDRSVLDGSIPPAKICGGAIHYVIALKTREQLAAMAYDLNQGRAFMRARELVTMMLVHRQADRLFNVRNAFASGGVLEDPATGAAAAAFAGYLRDAEILSPGRIEILQGQDMGFGSHITAEFGAEKGSSVCVSGTARKMVRNSNTRCQANPP